MADTFSLDDITLPDDSDIPALLAACPDVEALRFADQELLIRGGEESDDLFLLLKGCCLVEQPDAAEERRPGSELAIIEATPKRPVFVGEMAYLGQTDRTAQVRSAMSTWALRLHPNHLDAIIEQFPTLTALLCRQFAKRLRETNENLHQHQQRIALNREQIMLAPGDVLVEAKAPAQRLFQLVDGVLLRGAEESITTTPGQPRFIDAKPYFHGEKHPETLRAKTAAIVLAYGMEQKERIIRNFPQLVIDLL